MYPSLAGNVTIVITAFRALPDGLHFRDCPEAVTRAVDEVLAQVSGPGPTSKCDQLGVGSGWVGTVHPCG